MTSKAASYLLRHGAQKECVPIQPDGMMKINDLIKWLHTSGYHVDKKDIYQMVKDDQKGRYRIDTDKDIIGAVQGHSMDVTPSTHPWNQPGPLLHCSYIKHLKSIKETGLKRMTRQHIHLIYPDQPSWILARKNINLYIVINESDKHDLEFIKADNGVVLTSGIDGVIPSEYLTFIEAPRNTACYGFIIRDIHSGKILMVSTKNGHFGFPKGKKKGGEHSLCCALRELYEETGISVDKLTIGLSTYEEINDKGNCPTVYFEAHVDGCLPSKCLDLDEDLTTHWLSQEDIEKLSEWELYPRRRKVLHAVLNQ